MYPASMGSPRRVAAVSLAVLALVGVAIRAQDLPAIPLDTYPGISRGPIGRALEDARAHPGDAARIGKLGMVLQAWEQFDTAAAVYSRARALEKRFEWFYLSGVVEARAGRQDAAVRLLTDAVALAPANLPARLALADARFDAGDTDGAAKDYAGLTSGASAPHAHYGLGRCLAAKGDMTGALREFDEALRLFPEFGPAHYARGLALRSVGRADEAKEALVRSQQLGTRWPAVDDPALAGVRALRDDAAPHVTRGLALQKAGDDRGAIAEYEAALAANPETSAAHVNLIALYGKAQDWPRAADHYAALEKGGAVPVEAQFNYAQCLAAQRRTAEAAELLRKVIAVNPQHAGALSSLGQLAEMEGRVQEAASLYGQAAAAAPQDPVIRFNVGRMLIAERRIDDATAEPAPLRTATHPERPKFLFALATANVLAGRVADGRQLAVEARDLARARGQGALADAIDRELAKIQ
jgi:tetratricopeptide (TPR) repeat protein